MINFILQRDKQLHFLVGFLISLLISFFLPLAFACATAIAAGAVKELRDWKTGLGTPELADFLFTCAGALLVPILYSIF